MSAVESQFFFEIPWRSRAWPLTLLFGILVRDRKRPESYEEGDGMVNGKCIKLSVTLFVKVSVALFHGTLANMTMF